MTHLKPNPVPYVGDVPAKRANWKQTNPKDQLIAVLSALEGRLSIVLDESHFNKEFKDLFDQSQELVQLLRGEWPSKPNPSTLIHRDGNSGSLA